MKNGKAETLREIMPRWVLRPEQAHPVVNKH
jgi:hypothetical protein